MSEQAVVRPAPCRLLISESELCNWLGCSEPGQVLEYHRGTLAIDCSSESHRLPNEDRAGLRLVARRAQWAAERNLVHLLQRRYGSDDYGYLAVKRHAAGTRGRLDRPEQADDNAR